MKRILLCSVLTAVLAGCQSFEVMQRVVFANDSGDVVTVDYGRSEKDHVNWFTAPKTGERLAFKSRLAVRVELPDGKDFVAWQCMNPLPYGTLYKTDNEKWAFMANGFTCVVYEGCTRLLPDPAAGGTLRKMRDFRQVYYGIMCESPKIEVRKNDKWRAVDKPVTEAQRVHEKGVVPR